VPVHEPETTHARAGRNLSAALRALALSNHPLAYLCTEGAHEIERLRAENERFRAEIAWLTDLHG
jgi:hypothetical protein